jgi:hypothetical protein
MDIAPQQLGNVLIKAGLITSEQLDKALAAQESQKKFLGQVLIELGFISKDDLELALARQFNSKLGETLLKNKAIDWQQLSFALMKQRESQTTLGSVLRELRYVDGVTLAKALGQTYGYDYLELAQTPVDKAALKRLPKEICMRYCMIPVGIEAGVLVVALSDPENIHAIDNARAASRMKIRIVTADSGEIQRLLEL